MGCDHLAADAQEDGIDPDEAALLAMMGAAARPASTGAERPAGALPPTSLPSGRCALLSAATSDVLRRPGRRPLRVFVCVFISCFQCVQCTVLATRSRSHRIDTGLPVRAAPARM